jgi:hypothetical protein
MRYVSFGLLTFVCFLFGYLVVDTAMADRASHPAVRVSSWGPVRAERKSEPRGGHSGPVIRCVPAPVPANRPGK